MLIAGRPEVFRVLLGLGALVLGALLFVLRALKGRAAIEEAEATLRAEYDRLEEP
jgi:hypothetical protein